MFDSDSAALVESRLRAAADGELRLLAAVKRWARRRGWTSTAGPMPGWHSQDNSTQVGWFPQTLELGVLRRGGGWVGQWVFIPVSSVQQAIDILTALDLLPAEHSSAFQRGLQARTER